MLLVAPSGEAECGTNKCNTDRKLSWNLPPEGNFWGEEKKERSGRSFNKHDFTYKSRNEELLGIERTNCGPFRQGQFCCNILGGAVLTGALVPGRSCFVRLRPCSSKKLEISENDLCRSIVASAATRTDSCCIQAKFHQMFLCCSQRRGTKLDKIIDGKSNRELQWKIRQQSKYWFQDRGESAETFVYPQNQRSTNP